jgi:hypothetical protein
MPSQHKYRPIPFRPPERDRVRLLAYAERTGQPVNRILTEALTVYLEFLEAAERDTATGTNRQTEA